MFSLFRGKKKHVVEPLAQPVQPQVWRADFTVPVGKVRLTAAQGYYRHFGVYVHLPEGMTLTPALIDKFLDLTDGELHIDPAPDLGSGAEGGADAIVTRGLDYAAYSRGESKGYFKEGGKLDHGAVSAYLIRLFASEEAINARLSSA